jgi:hypothetical protein
MTYFSNGDIIAAIAHMKSAIEADAHDGVRELICRELIRAGIIDTMPSSVLEPFRPLPEDWTAIQFEIFDNGVQLEKRRRPNIQLTKMRYGARLRLWTDTRINFRDAKQIAWTSNLYFWDHTIAVRVANELLDKKQIDPETVELMEGMVERGGSEYLYAIPVARGRKSGTHWLRGTVMMIKIEDGKPAALAAVHPAGNFSTQAFETELPNGKPLEGNTIAHARLARISSLAPWATDDKSPA